MISTEKVLSIKAPIHRTMQPKNSLNLGFFIFIISFGDIFNINMGIRPANSIISSVKKSPNIWYLYCRYEPIVTNISKNIINTVIRFKVSCLLVFEFKIFLLKFNNKQKHHLVKR